ncbi:MAG TPA: hypothetical protein VN238_07685 [Solirubrobacteraceae bacterium]|nr:hypothetical protein [Solirubrobacteraceae bacterium]
MRFFSRSSARRPPLLTATPAELARLGRIAFGGDAIHPPGINGLPPGDLDRHALAFLEAAGYPAAGSEAEAEASSRFLDEITNAADSGGAWAFVGAMLVVWNTLGEEHRRTPRALAITDRALERLRRDGVAYTSVPPFAMQRWQAVHGFDGPRPAGWPSPLKDLALPAAEDVSVANLQEGEVRRLATSPAAPANTILAERRLGGAIQAVVEGPDPETGQTQRWDWEGLNAPDYASFLRELGERLVTHTAWAHDDLMPFFPCRQRSRDELRRAADG